jgi:hypothetical protein
MKEYLRGRAKQWQLLEKFSEGDAGEIWLVQATNSQHFGVLKRPVTPGYGGEVYRQAAQITLEGSILGNLKGAKVDIAGARMQTVKLLDRNLKDKDNGSNTFIVLEKAPGFDLNFLSQVHNSRKIDQGQLNERELKFLQLFSRLDQFPELLLTRMAAGLASLLKKVHNYSINLENKSYTGIVWNDVKMEHIFWDPFHNVFTVIDWGNAQLLGADRISYDRRFSPDGDFQQFITIIEQFILQNSSSLAQVLSFSDYKSAQKNVQSLLGATTKRAEQTYLQLQEVRRKEGMLLDLPVTTSSLEKLQALSHKIVSHGESPSSIIAQKYREILLKHSVINLNLTEFTQAANLSGNVIEKDWDTLYKIAQVAKKMPEGSKDKENLKKAIQSGLEKKWPEAFWNLQYRMDDQAPDWWREVRDLIRGQILSDKTSKTPVEILNRVITKLDNHNKTSANMLRENIIDWKKSAPIIEEGELINYSYLDHVNSLVIKSNSTLSQSFEVSMRQPQMLAGMATDAWQSEDFSRARNVLRQWLVHDPDRSRIFTLDMYFLKAATWLEKVTSGPPKLEQEEDPWYQRFNPIRKAKPKEPNFREFASTMHKAGEGFIGIAKRTPWLEERLAILSDLDKGEKPGKVLHRHPNASKYFPWLGDGSPEYKPWEKREAEEFYKALKVRLYDDADRIAGESTLKHWPGYKILVEKYIEFDETWQDRYVIDKTIGFPIEDDEKNNAVNVLHFLYSWVRILEQKGMKRAIENLKTQINLYDDWSIITGLDASINKWRDAFGRDSIVNFENWSNPAWNKLPEELNNLSQNLVKAQKAWISFSTFASQRWESDYRKLYEHFKNAELDAKKWEQTNSKDLATKLLKRSHEIFTLVENSKSLAKRSGEVWEIYRYYSSNWQARSPVKSREVMNILTHIEDGLTGGTKDTWAWINHFKNSSENKYFLSPPQTVLSDNKHPLYPWYHKYINTPLDYTCMGFVVFVVIGCMGALIWLSKFVNPTEPKLASEEITLTAQSHDSEDASPAPENDTPPAPETPGTTVLANPTPIPGIPTLCMSYKDLANEGQWGQYGTNLVNNIEIYSQLQDECGWLYTYKAHMLDAALLDLLVNWDKDNQTDSEQVLRDLHINNLMNNPLPPRFNKQSNLGAEEYAHWLRASLALCNLPDPDNTLESRVLEEYLEWHKTRFNQADDIFETICNKMGNRHFPLGILNSEKEVKVKSILEIGGWGKTGASYANCSALDDYGNARWINKSAQEECHPPSGLTPPLPNWDQSSALNLRFCGQSMPLSKVPLTFWLHQPNIEYGLQFVVEDSKLRSLTPVLNWQKPDDQTRALPEIYPKNLLGLSKDPSIRCENEITILPVWVGNLLIWQYGGFSETDEAPRILPMVANVWTTQSPPEWPVEFYWSLEGDIEEDIHLRIPALDIITKEEK